MAGPAMMRQSSSTRMPERIWGFVVVVAGIERVENGAAGEES